MSEGDVFVLSMSGYWLCRKLTVSAPAGNFTLRVFRKMDVARGGSAHLRRIERRISSIVWPPPQATLDHPFLVEGSPMP